MPDEDPDVHDGNTKPLPANGEHGAQHDAQAGDDTSVDHGAPTEPLLAQQVAAAQAHNDPAPLTARRGTAPWVPWVSLVAIVGVLALSSAILLPQLMLPAGVTMPSPSPTPPSPTPTVSESGGDAPPPAEPPPAPEPSPTPVPTVDPSPVPTPEPTV